MLCPSARTNNSLVCNKIQKHFHENLVKKEDTKYNNRSNIESWCYYFIFHILLHFFLFNWVYSQSHYTFSTNYFTISGHSFISTDKLKCTFITMKIVIVQCSIINSLNESRLTKFRNLVLVRNCYHLSVKKKLCGNWPSLVCLTRSLDFIVYAQKRTR